MPYTRIKAQRIINRVSRLMNQLPFTNEDTAVDSNILASPTTRFNTDEYLEMINSACLRFVNSSKACHVYNAVLVDDETSLTGVKNVTSGSKAIIRLLRNRIKVDGVRAFGRRVDQYKRIAEAGRAGDATHPVYTFEAGEVRVYPTPQATQEIAYVTQPDPVSSVNDSLPIDERFEAAVVYYVASLSYAKLQRSDLSELMDQIWQDEISVFDIDLRTGILNDKEVEVE